MQHLDADPGKCAVCNLSWQSGRDMAAEIRSMIAVHNSDVDGMRMQEEKIADQKKVIAALREALEPERLARIVGALWMGSPKEQDVLDETVRAIREGVSEQTVEEKS
jgi:hypothetical protein